MRMVKAFRYYFQHPWSRLIVAYLVTFFNFLIFAEDPISHSQAPANVIVVGNCFSFVANKYPGGGWNFLKVLLWLLAIVTGLFAGKFLFHQLMFGKLKPNLPETCMVVMETTLGPVICEKYVFKRHLLEIRNKNRKGGKCSAGRAAIVKEKQNEH